MMRNPPDTERDDSRASAQQLEPSVIIAGVLYLFALLALIVRLIH